MCHILLGCIVQMCFMHLMFRRQTSTFRCFYICRYLHIHQTILLFVVMAFFTPISFFLPPQQLLLNFWWCHQKDDWLTYLSHILLHTLNWIINVEIARVLHRSINAIKRNTLWVEIVTEGALLCLNHALTVHSKAYPQNMMLNIGQLC